MCTWQEVATGFSLIIWFICSMFGWFSSVYDRPEIDESDKKAEYLKAKVFYISFLAGVSTFLSLGLMFWYFSRGQESVSVWVEPLYVLCIGGSILALAMFVARIAKVKLDKIKGKSSNNDFENTSEGLGVE